MIDYINRVKNDNRFSNLREASGAENQSNRGPNKNNTSGYKGVSWNVKSNKWVAQMNINGKRTGLGYYQEIEDAIEAYKTASSIYHGSYSSI